MKDFRELKVWEKAHRLTLLAYKLTEGFPRHELFGLASQVRRCSSSIPANIAEGCGRLGNSEFHRFLQIACGSISELEYHFLLSRDLGFLTESDYFGGPKAASRPKAHAGCVDTQSGFGAFIPLKRWLIANCHLLIAPTDAISN
ncbi:MAG TPA: four helix bundle protein [Candidatus Angelobacter sp.]